MQKRAIAVLGGMGPAAATAPVLGALARLAQSEDTPGDLSREAQGALERIHGSAVGEPTEAAPCETPDGLDTRSSASGQAPTGGLRAVGVSDAGRSAAGDTAPGREETTQQRQSQEDLRKALEDPDWRASNAAGWRLLENAQEPDLLAEAVRHMIFQWGYVFDERLTAGSTIGSLGALARRRPEVIAQVVPKLGPAMEVVVSAFGMEEVRSAAVDAITQRTACGVRLFRRGQAVWEALRVEELSG